MKTFFDQIIIIFVQIILSFFGCSIVLITSLTYKFYLSKTSKNIELYYAEHPEKDMFGLIMPKIIMFVLIMPKLFV